MSSKKLPANKFGWSDGDIEIVKKVKEQKANIAHLLPIARALVLRAGARHSQADVTDVQAMHDLACKLGAKCKTISDGTRTQFSTEAMKSGTDR